MRRKLYDALRNISIYRRLWISNIATASIPILLISSLLLLVFTNIMKQSIEKYSGNLTLQVGNYIDLQVQQLNSDIANFSGTAAIRDFLHDYPYMNLRERYEALQATHDDISNQFSKLSDVSDIVLLTRDLRHSIHVYGNSDADLGMTNPKISEIMLEVSSSIENTNYGVLYVPDFSENGSFTVIKRVFELQTGTYLGYILVCMREEFMSSTYPSWEDLGNGNIYVLDPEGRVMSSNEKEAVGTLYPLYAQMEGNQGILSDATYPGRSERYTCVYNGIRPLGLTVICLIPGNYLSSSMFSIFVVVVLSALVLIVLTTMSSQLVMNSITQPVSELIARMERAQNNALTQNDRDDHRDELATVINTFDQTLTRLSAYTEEIRRNEQEIARLEMQALTAQISPHFLTNVLNTVKNLASLQNANNIESMVGSLINLVTTSLGRHRTLVTLYEEIQLSKDFFNLQKYRYFNEIALEVLLEDGVQECLIPTFSLQPLVDNALRHGGLDARLDGRIVIRARRTGENVRITVTDNGSGIAPERLAEVLRLRERMVSLPSDHIGLQNVHQRLKLLFGADYGVDVVSEEGVYTEVSLLIPLHARETIDGGRQR